MHPESRWCFRSNNIRKEIPHVRMPLLTFSLSFFRSFNISQSNLSSLSWEGTTRHERHSRIKNKLHRIPPPSKYQMCRQSASLFLFFFFFPNTIYRKIIASPSWNGDDNGIIPTRIRRYFSIETCATPLRWVQREIKRTHDPVRRATWMKANGK